MLEEGGYFTAKDFTQREEEMFPALYRAGAQQFTDDGLINVLQGSCYGGSTVINTADCVPIPPEVFAHWNRHFGVVARRAELEDSGQRVFAMLRVQPNPARPGEREQRDRARGRRAASAWRPAPSTTTAWAASAAATA